MAQVIEDTAGKIRDLPIKPQLKQLLLTAAQAAGVDEVRVISGGQCKIGTCPKRTGSPRHDDGNAADLKLIVGGHTLNFENAADRQIFARFLSSAAAEGATGIGAAANYMGPETAHVGYGLRAVWGAGGKSANAPQRLIQAVQAGWGMPLVAGELKSIASLDSNDPEIEEDSVD